MYRIIVYKIIKFKNYLVIRFKMAIKLNSLCILLKYCTSVAILSYGCKI